MSDSNIELLAQEAYLAYSADFKNWQDSPLIKWEDLSDTIKSAWVAAVEKVTVTSQRNIDRLIEAKNNVYKERNLVLLLLCKLVNNDDYSVNVEKWLHPEEDDSWEQDWKNIIAIEVEDFEIHTMLEKNPVYQMTWHIHDSENELFAFLPVKPSRYDGHSSEQKYQVIKELPA